MNKNHSIRFYISLTFLVSFLPRFILCFFSYPANFPGDELTTAASAATAYGLDYSNVLSIGRYYGQGFSILFTPLYYVTNNPIILFRSMNMVYALLQSLVSLIAFHCLRKYFKIDNLIYVAICSIGCSYLLETRATIISNEHPLLLICWLITWVLLILHSHIENSKQKVIYTIILVLLLVYSLTLHTRAVTLWIALAGCVLFYFWVYRKWLVSLPVFALLGAGGAVAGSIAIAYVQRNIWAEKGSAPLDNSHFNIDLSNFLLLKDVTSWQAWVNIIIGQINTVYIVSCGMAMIGIIILFHLFWNSLLRKPEIVNGPDSTIYSKFVMIGSFFCIAVILTIGGQSISWLPGVTEGIKGGFGSQNYNFKAFTYFRYFALYTSPLLMLTFAYVYLYKEKLTSYFKTSTITVILLQAYFIVCVVPYNYNFQEYSTTKFRPFILFLTGRKTNIYTFLGACIVVFGIWLIIWLCYHKKKIIIPALLVTTILIYHYTSLAVHFDFNNQERRYNMINSSYDLMTRIGDNDRIPKDIYIILQEGDTSTARYFTYQFYLNHYTISPWQPDPSLEEGIAFYSHPDYEYLVDLGYECTQLDNNEYIYIKGEELQSLFKEYLN